MATYNGLIARKEALEENPAEVRHIEVAGVVESIRKYDDRIGVVREDVARRSPDEAIILEMARTPTAA